VFFKAAVIIVLICAIFGTAAYFGYDLFIRPQKALEEERRRGPLPPPADPTLPAFLSCLQIQQQGDLLAARAAFESFLEHNPQSSKLEEAKERLGGINTDLFFSPQPLPEKQVYVVRPGDVLNKVARITKTTPELLMRANNLQGTMLRINQQLHYTPAEFSLLINRKTKKVTLLNRGRFFKQYPIRSLPKMANPKKPAVAPSRLQGRVLEKIAWGASGGRVIFTDKEFVGATHWISLSIAGHTLYAEPDPQSGKRINKPPTGGIGIAPEAAAELAVLLTKGNPVTIE
jgi:LysM repeat protein